MKLAKQIISLCEAETVKVLGTDDSTHTCDRCGKNDLKMAYVLEIDDEIGYFGSECVNKMVGMDRKTLKKEAREQQDRIKKIISREIMDSEENKAYSKKGAEARKQGLLGVPFKEFTRKELEALRSKEKEIKDRYDIEQYKKIHKVK